MAGEMTQLSETVLGKAILNGDLREVKRLVEDGEDATFIDRKGNTYVHLTCTTYRPYIIHVLLTAGVNVNAQNKDGNTALHVTALQDECCHVPDLMSRGVDPFLKNKDGKLAIDLAENNSHWKALYEKYYPGLRVAIEKHDVTRVTELLRSWCAVDPVVRGKDMRQFAAALTYHDIVAMLDAAKLSLMAVYAVFELDYSRLKYALSRPLCDVNYTRKGALCKHILQHAIQLGEYKMVCMLLERGLDAVGADVNIPVHIKDYVMGPLFFEVIRSTEELDEPIIWKVLNSNIDLTARDQRGRTALIYAVDRVNKGVSLDIIEFLLKKGANMADRDETGCTARDIAMFARRKDVIKVIDKYMIKKIKSGDTTDLWRLAMQGYDHFIVDYQYRDSWIYAAGNETDDVTKFLEELADFKKQSADLQRAAREGDVTKLRELLSDRGRCRRLLMSRDKGGRTPLIKAVLCCQQTAAEFIIQQPDCPIGYRDNRDRTALHYAYALGEDGSEIQEILLQAGASETARDTAGRTPEEYIELGYLSDFIDQEKKAKYGMEIELHCLQKYEELLKVVESNHKSLRHFLKILKQVRYPVAKFPALFAPNGHHLLEGYKDLLLAAIGHGKLDIARKLVDINVDCTQVEQFETEDGPVMMNALDRAQLLGYSELAEYIQKKHANKQAAA